MARLLYARSSELVGALILLALTCSSAWAEPQRVIVSDLDDTLKRSNVENKLDTAFRGVFSSSAFAGMPELAQGLAREGEFILLSNSPKIIKPRVRSFLKKHRIPAKRVFLRSRSARVHKPETLRRLAAEYRGAEFVLVGDDTQRDSAVYAEFKKAQPERVRTILIHRVDGLPIESEQRAGYTAFDLAYEAVAAGVLSADDAISIGFKVLYAPKGDVRPRWSYCPSASEIEAQHPERLSSYAMEEMRKRVADWVSQICSR